MDKLLTFLHAYRLDHIILGLVFIGLLHLCSLTLLESWALQCAYWYGREVRDVEIHKLLVLPQEFYKAFFMWTWSKDSLLDLWLPVIVNYILIQGIQYAS